MQTVRPQFGKVARTGANLLVDDDIRAVGQIYSLIDFSRDRNYIAVHYKVAEEGTVGHGRSVRSSAGRLSALRGDDRSIDIAVQGKIQTVDGGGRAALVKGSLRRGVEFSGYERALEQNSRKPLT